MWMSLYLILFLLSCSFSLLVTGHAIRWAGQWGFMDAPGERKVHHTTKPRLGGLGVFAGFYLALLLSLLAIWYTPTEWLPNSWREAFTTHRAGIAKEWLTLLGLLGGGLLVFAGGLIDDHRSLSPRAKMAWQVAGSLFAITLGFRLDFYKVFWHHPSGEYLFAIPFTLFWMVFVINAFNLLDNMDGLSGGVAAIATTFFAIYAHWQGEYFLAATMICLVGALLGFLRYNWNPSQIFMGDGGALLVGYLIAAFTCRCTYYHATPGAVIEWFVDPIGAEARQGLLAILTPLVIMAVPIFDTTTVVFIRWRNGKPLMVGDTNHFSHRLVALGLSHKSAVEVIYMVTIFTGLGALILQSAQLAQAILVFLQVVSVFAMILLLENRQRRQLKGEVKETTCGGK